MLLFHILFACEKQEEIVNDCVETVTDTAIVQTEPSLEPEEEIEEEDFSMWDMADLRILSPLPSQKIAIGEQQEFHAEILNIDGEIMEFEEIIWSTNQNEDWRFTGSQFTDATLPVGEQSIKAEAILPNNNRLVYAIGGVRVQHPDAGTYSGTTTIDATITDWSGNETIVSCAGSAIVEVDLEGTTAVGGTSCVLQLFEQDVDTTYDFQIEVQSPDLGGVAIADLGITQRDFPLTGTIGDGVLAAAWTDTVYGTVLIEGSMVLQRVE